MKRETNIPFCLLSVLGIIFVVDGHLNHSFFDIGGLIPYYAFHMPLFVFISGYENKQWHMKCVIRNQTADIKKAVIQMSVYHKNNPQYRKKAERYVCFSFHFSIFLICCAILRILFSMM